MNDELRLAELRDLPEICRLIRERIAWMDRVGIRQWNVMDYWQAYPETYYEAQVRAKRFYVLDQAEGGGLAGAAALLEADGRWADAGSIPACYVHHLVTNVREKGAGRIILTRTEALARRWGKTRVRLDCAADNARLNQYYEGQGYRLAGTCQEGPYAGNLREKLLEG